MGLSILHKQTDLSWVEGLRNVTQNKEINADVRNKLYFKYQIVYLII